MGTWGGLSRFDLLWEVLYPQEETRIVHVLVERVVFDGEDGGIQIVSHSDGLGMLAAEPQGAPA